MYRKGERPYASLKAATARAMAAEGKARALEEQVQGLTERLKEDYVEKAEELQGYDRDDYNKVVMLDMALDFARVRVKTAERELKETRAGQSSRRQRLRT